MLDNFKRTIRLWGEFYSSSLLAILLSVGLKPQKRFKRPINRGESFTFLLSLSVGLNGPYSRGESFTALQFAFNSKYQRSTTIYHYTVH